MAPTGGMHRRDWLKAAGMAAAASTGRAWPAGAADNPGGVGSGGGGKKRPNILYIMADDHTSQAWGCYGSRLAKFAHTRHIDRIAAEGARLANCFCTNSICVPSRATILTGQYSHLNGAHTLGGRLRGERDNVAKHLRRAGYRTAIVGKWHLKDPPAGFDYYNVLHGQGRYHNPVLWSNTMPWKGKGKTYQGHSTDVITDLALEWLKKRPADAGKPFCLMCHFKAVHEPFYSHDRYRKLYEGQDLPEPADLLGTTGPEGGRIPGWPLEVLKDRFLKRPSNYSPPPLDVTGKTEDQARRATYQKFVKDFLRTVAGLNDNVGRLLAYLDEAGLAQDTVVIYTADQGYFLGEHNLFDKRLMLEESLRMPFVIRYPREVKPGTVLNDIVLNIDFAELFLDYAAAAVPDSMQGRSFRANLQGRTPNDWRDAMYYHYWTHQDRRPSHYGIRTQRYKLMYYYGLVRMGRKPGQCWEFYDLQADPQELKNRCDEPKYAKVIAGLKTRLAALREEFEDTADPLKAGGGTRRKRAKKRKAAG